jgi:2-polyprenyl-3-methyl-5-hydroxy-6-metoxy-1,4-benzoquinol methylase
MLVQNTLRGAQVHKAWMDSYRQAENEKFDRMAFDWVLGQVKLPHGAMVLDAGCGDARHSLRLAAAGLNVMAIDSSDFAVDDARDRLETAGAASRITLQQADLTNLNLPGSQFDAVFCMGVLMHIPDMDAALRHMSRVIKPGGHLILSESSMSGFDNTLRRILYALKPSPALRLQRNDGAMEFWSKTEAGELLTRTHEISALISRLARLDMSLATRRPAEFTEFYRRAGSGAMYRAVHAFNRFWFRSVGFAAPSTGQLLIFRKRA